MPALCSVWMGLKDPPGLPLNPPLPPRSVRIGPRPNPFPPFIRAPSWKPFTKPLLRPLSHPPGESEREESTGYSTRRHTSQAAADGERGAFWEAVSQAGSTPRPAGNQSRPAALKWFANCRN